MQSVDNPAIIKLYSIRCLLQVNIVAVFQNSQGSCDLWEFFCFRPYIGRPYGSGQSGIKRMDQEQIHAFVFI